MLSCSNKETQAANSVSKLSAADFESKIKQSAGPQIIDVRTPEEFSQGHLANAINIDWKNTETFKSKLAALDKTKPTLVYCKKGPRSTSASEYMHDAGFKEIYELDGGIVNWESANLSIVSDTTVEDSPAGMTVQQFEELLITDKYVLVDFYATWCGPCKQMEPALEEISKTMADKVIVIRIDVDQNEIIAKHFQIESLPTVQIYKNQKLVWDDIGYKTKKQLLKAME